MRAVDLAIRLAREGLSEIMLVALAPEPRSEDDLDPDFVRALLMETELGLGLGRIVPAADEKARVRQRYELVLLPLEQRVHAAGVPVKLRVLCGENLQEQFRDLLAGSTPRPAVVLCNPLKLFGPLRELTSALWADPHPVTYIADLESRGGDKGSLVRRLLGCLGMAGSREPADPLAV
jgi:hypothetical protein